MLNNNINPMINNMNQNMGMNPMMNNMNKNMEMNPMINNMNQNMGMNGINQSNFMYMDSTAQNIKSIIEPYEKKIRELEEIIKQKDFEIIVLKQKLNNNQNNNWINMNMNQMNMMVGNINNINQQMNKKIQLIIKSENNKLDIISCLENIKCLH